MPPPLTRLVRTAGICPLPSPDWSAQVWDRGSLIAIEPPLRRQYVDLMADLMRLGGRILLVSQAPIGQGGPARGSYWSGRPSARLLLVREAQCEAPIGQRGPARGSYWSASL
eukprot:546396-Prorocentrum_minimum.AAC.1